MTFPCPNCDSDVELYNIAEDKKNGRYYCKGCGRDTAWKEIDDETMMVGHAC